MAEDAYCNVNYNLRWIWILCHTHQPLPMDKQTLKSIWLSLKSLGVVQVLTVNILLCHGWTITSQDGLFFSSLHTHTHTSMVVFTPGLWDNNLWFLYKSWVIETGFNDFKENKKNKCGCVVWWTVIPICLYVCMCLNQLLNGGQKKDLPLHYETGTLLALLPPILHHCPPHSQVNPMVVENSCYHYSYT